MKFFYLAAMVVTLVVPGAVFADTTTVNFSVNQTIPDADANGVALAGNVSGLVGLISDLTVSVNITNGFNGDLYAYLTGPNGGFAVLLNRTGVSSLSPVGFGNPGFNIVFTNAGGNDVHYYQNFNPTFNAGGQLTGVWAPDGRNIDPTSPPASIGATSPTALLNSFNGTDPNGIWVLFLADFSNGGLSILKNWGLNITTTPSVPEPGTLALLSFGIGLQMLLKQRRR